MEVHRDGAPRRPPDLNSRTHSPSLQIRHLFRVNGFGHDARIRVRSESESPQDARHCQCLSARSVTVTVTVTSESAGIMIRAGRGASESESAPAAAGGPGRRRPCTIQVAPGLARARPGAPIPGPAGGLARASRRRHCDTRRSARRARAGASACGSGPVPPLGVWRGGRRGPQRPEAQRGGRPSIMREVNLLRLWSRFLLTHSLW
jgi:hypothetical protein